MSWRGLATFTTVQPGAGDAARAADDLVRALHGLERHRRAVLDHHRLPEVEAGEGAGDLPPVLDVLLLVRGRAGGASSAPACASWSCEERGRGQEGDALARQGVGDRRRSGCPCS